MMKKGKLDLKSRLNSFKYAGSGMISLFRNEHNSRIHLVAAILAFILGLVLHINITGWIVISIAISLVFITELINSAIEMIADTIDPEFNPAIKLIKDYSAASVLISAIVSVIAGSLIFVPGIIELFKS